MAIRKEYNQSWNPFWLNMPESGTKDYEELENLPEINNTEVKGDKTGADYGLGDANMSDLAPAFSDATNYEAGDIVISPDGKLCYFPVDHSAGALQPGELVETNVAEQIEMNSGSLPVASDETLGGVKVGDGLTIDANGVLSEEDMVVRRYQFMRTGMNTGTAYSPSSGAMDITVNQYYDAARPLFFQFEFTGTPVTSDSDRDLAALNGSFFLTVNDLQSAKTVSDTFRTIKKKVFMGVYNSKEIWAMVNLEIKYDPYVSEDGIWPSYKFNAASMNIAAADGSDLPEGYISVYLWVRGSKTKVG